MNLYITLRLLRFSGGRGGLFATIYNLYIIYRSYFIPGFGAGNIIIDPYLQFLAMHSNFYFK